jgi:hypothetical protein
MNEIKDYKNYLKLQFTDYPDMLTSKHVQQITGHSPNTIASWCNQVILSKSNTIVPIFYRKRVLLIICLTVSYNNYS